MKAIKKAYIELEGYGGLHYRYAGDPALPTMILLHQAPSSSAMFEPLMSALAADFYLWAPDMPGFGDSPALKEAMSIEALAKVCHQATQELGFDDYLLFGHHTGTAVALALASNNQSVRKLLLCGPALLSAELSSALPGRATPFPVQENGQHLLKHWQRMRGKDTTIPLAITQREMLLALQMEDRYQQAYQAVADYDFATALLKVQAPTQLCAGSKDLLIASVAQAAAILRSRSKPVNVTTETIPEAGSYVCETHSPELVSMIRAYCH